MTTDIGKLPTQKQLEWLDDNRGDIVSAAWGSSHSSCFCVGSFPMSVISAPFSSVSVRPAG